MPADGKAVRSRLPTPIHKLAARRSCMLIKSAAVSAASRVPLVSLALPCPVGSKKRSSASCFVYNSARPRSPRSRFYDPGTRRALVVCAQKSTAHLDLDCPVPQDAIGGRLCSGRSEQTDMPATVGSDSAGVSAGALLHGFLGGLRGDPRGAALCSGKRDGRNRPCRAVEQHIAPTARPFCAHDVVIFQVGDHA